MTQTPQISQTGADDARLMCLATHHKGGTVWMKSIIQALSAAWNIPMIGIWSDLQLSKIPQTGRAFLVNWHGTFPQDLWDRADARFVHIIRDPRDVLISGCEYHHFAGPKGEGFLHSPRADLGGLTYQQAINRIEDVEGKLLFEMREKHAETLREMMNWPYDHPHSVTVTYEDLMADHHGVTFRKAIAHWGLSAAEQDHAAQVFWDNSLFGGLAHDDARSDHVQTGTTQKWRDDLPYLVGQVYAKEFGQDLIALGYEKNMDWVDGLAQSPSTASAASSNMTAASGVRATDPAVHR